MLRRTVLGRRLYAVGDNAQAARLCGVPVLRLRALAYVGCGALAGVCGVLTAARTGVISPSIGVGMEFFAIAVVALGAGGLPSGRIRVGQTIVGALILMMVFNYMTIRGVPGTWQTTATGFLLLAAMLAGRLIQGRHEGGESVGEAFVDVSGRLGTALGRNAIVGGDASPCHRLCLRQSAFRDARQRHDPDRAERRARHRGGWRDARYPVALGRHFARQRRRARRRRCGTCAERPAMPELAVGAGVVACLAVYGLNGLVVGGLGLDPLIVTLAAWIWARGLAISLTGATTLPFDPGFVAFMNTPIVLGFTPAVVLVAGAFLLGWIVLTRLPIGMRIYALGNDARMLRQSGADERRVRVATLLIMGASLRPGWW